MSPELRYALHAALALIPVVVTGGCSGDTDALVVVAVDSISVIQPARLHVRSNAGGHDSSAFDIPVAGKVIPPSLTFGVRVPAAFAGPFTVTIDAVDAKGATLVTGEGHTTAVAGQRRDVSVRLGGAVADGGPPDLSALPCTHTLCETFENGLDPQMWGSGSQEGTITIDGTRAHTGMSSAHFHVDAPAMGNHSQAAISNPRTVGTLPDGFFVRAFIYLREPFPNADFISVHSGGNGMSWMQLEREGIMLSLHGSNDFFSRISITPLRTEGWRCLEWQVLKPSQDDAGAGSYEVRVWLDGNEVQPLRRARLPRSPFELIAFGIGLNYAPGVVAGDLWLDDIAIDATPIGCN